MALQSYSDLLAAIESWTARDDVGLRASDFVSLAEDAIQEDLADLPALQASSTLTTVIGQLDYDMPADMMALQSVENTSLPYGGPDRDVKIRALFDFVECDPTLRGTPRAIATNGRKLTLDRIPDGIFTLRLYHTKRIPPLTDAQPTNWLLQQSRRIYLYGSLVEASNFIKDEARGDRWKMAYNSAVAAIKRQHWDGNPTLTTDPALQRRTTGYNVFSDTY